MHLSRERAFARLDSASRKPSAAPIAASVVVSSSGRAQCAADQPCPFRATASPIPSAPCHPCHREADSKAERSLERSAAHASPESKPRKRRAACVALIRGTRERRFFREIVRLSNQLLDDKDDMVQKGLGWLLRETAKADPQRTVPYLMKIRKRSPRLVLRTACETLNPAARKRVLG